MKTRAANDQQARDLSRVREKQAKTRQVVSKKRHHLMNLKKTGASAISTKLMNYPDEKNELKSFGNLNEDSL